MLAAARSTNAAATDRLIQALEDADPIVREWALEALARRKRRDDVPARLLPLLRDRRADVRWYAARALGKLGVLTPDIREALEAALTDSDLYVRAFAAWALGQLRSQETTPILREHLLELSKQGKGMNEEAYSLGVALMRLDTAARTDQIEPIQQTLFELPTGSDAGVGPGERPKTRREILQGELLRTAELVRQDRGGEPVTVRGKLATRFQYLRSQTLKQTVLSERGPRCQLCGFTFMQVNGTLYAESHHVLPVSQGGPDREDNILVLCPNHHRQLHCAQVSFPSGHLRPGEITINGETTAVRWDATPMCGTERLGR